MSALEKYTDRLIQQAYEQGKHDFAARVIDAIECEMNKYCTDDYLDGLKMAIIIIQRLERDSDGD